MNMRGELARLLQLMVDGRYISEWQMGYILGVVDMTTMINLKRKMEENDDD